MNLPPLSTLSITPGAIVGLLLLALLGRQNRAAGRPIYKHWEHLAGVLGVGMLIDGQYMGLVDAPSEAMMGHVGRILYVHVPAAWLTMLTFTFTCIFAFAFLMTGKKTFDYLVEATAEVGVVLSILLQLTGMLFAKPTWGVFWDWDPRLVSTSVMMLSFIGVLTLRSVIDDPDRRATWTSVGAILATTSMLVTYFSVQWWRSVHQMQSSPSTVASPMVFILRFNAFAVLFLSVWFTVRRYRIAAARGASEQAPALPEKVIT